MLTFAHLLTFSHLLTFAHLPTFTQLLIFANICSYRLTSSWGCSVLGCCQQSKFPVFLVIGVRGHTESCRDPRNKPSPPVI